VDLRWGNPIKASRKQFVYQVLGCTNDGFFTLVGKTSGLYRTSMNQITLQKCNLNGELIKTTELKFPSPEGKENDFVNFVRAKDQFYLFSSYYNKKSDVNSAYFTQINNSGEMEKNTYLIDKIDASKKYNSGSYSVCVSKDTSKILFYHNDPYEKKEPESFNLQVYNNGMQKLWEKKISLPYKDKDVSIESFTVSNNGMVYVLARYQEGLRDKVKGLPNYRYFILRYGKSESNSKQYDVSLGENFIASITFDLDPKMNFICAGFYSANNKSTISGVFYLRLDGQTGEVNKKNTKVFDEDALAKFESKSKANRGKALKNYTIRNPIIRDDGGMVLMGEQYYWYVETTQSSNGMTYSTTHFFYNNILAANINPNGGIDWITAIPKYQHSVNDDGYYLSYVPLVYKDKIYLIYNDNKKNVNIKGNKKLKTMNNIRKSSVVMAVIDSKGQVTKSELLKTKDLKKVYVRPKVSTQVSENRLILVGEKNFNFMYGIVNLR
jgi:hypothetical protein